MESAVALIAAACVCVVAWWLFSRVEDSPLDHCPVLHHHGRAVPKGGKPLSSEEWNRNHKSGAVHGAHRGGASRFGPENTLPTYRKCIEETRTSLLELDVQPTKDGRVVIMHDLTVDRTTNGGNRAVDSFTFDEIRKLDCAYHFQGVDEKTGELSYTLRGRGYVVPSLEEVLQEFQDTEDLHGRKICFFIDFKHTQVIAPVLKLIRQYDLTRRVIFGGVSPGVNRAIAKLKPPEVPLAADKHTMIILFILYNLGLMWLYPMRHEMVGATYFRWGRRVVTEKLLRAFQQRGRVVAVFGADLDDPRVVRNLLEWGTDYLLADSPNVLRDELCEWDKKWR